MMRQVIHGCSNWRHRNHNDTVPILILIIITVFTIIAMTTT